MELNLSELDNTNTMNPYDTFDHNSYEQQGGDNYWDKPKVEEKQTRRKKVSFNDILSNMNLVVNNQGVLQFMMPNQEESQGQYNPNEFNKPQYQQQPYQKQPQKNSQSIEPSVKHSYIYNKYFKDYADPNVEREGPRVPKTIEEYNQMLLEDRIKAIEHRKILEQVKSKKLLFTTTPGMGTNPRNIHPTKNNLRRMNFG